MALQPEHITIAVTVYDRREYVLQAIASALEQTMPVRVMVVEDCGPDSGLREFVLARFGNRITYHRNSRRRGLFDNWNACLELCPTPWLSILHDDDLLEPAFVETMIQLSTRVPQARLLFGANEIMDEQGRVTGQLVIEGTDGALTELPLIAQRNPIGFPGQLMEVAATRRLGGFRATSLYCGDWELWFKLAVEHGAAQTVRKVGRIRQHGDERRGTTKVELSGKRYGLMQVQRKRNCALLLQRGLAGGLKRKELLQRGSLPSRYLFHHAAGFSPRMLAYNTGLFLTSPPPHWRYRLAQGAVKILGTGFVRMVSRSGLEGWI